MDTNVESQEIKEQVIKEIIQSIGIPILSGLAFLIWVYNIITSDISGLLIFPTSIIILIVLYFFSGVVYSSILLGLLTIVGFFNIVLMHSGWTPFMFLFEIFVLWGTFFVVKRYRKTFINEQNRMREEEESVDTKISFLETEIEEVKKRRANLVRQISDYLSLGQIVHIFSSTLQEEKVIPLISETAKKYIGRGTWRVVKGSGGNIFSEYIEKQNLPLIIRDLTNDNRFYVKNPKFLSLIAIPLEANDTFWGILEGTAANRNAFDEDDLRFLSILGGIASLALNNVYLYKTTQELAITDALTGLYVQSYFKERLEDELQRSKRHNLSLSVAIIDIDHFKSLNDTYGHIAGDSILRQLADILRHRLRETDFLCRYGGEEFAVIMPQTDINEAEQVSHEIRKSISTERFYLPVESFKPVQAKLTISIGLSSLSEYNKGVKELLSRADDALYKAKENGRNRIEISDS